MPIEPSALRKERRGSLCAFVPMRTLTVARGMGHLIVGETLILSRQKHKEVGEGISGSKRPRRANHDRARNKSRTIEVYIRTITFLEANPQCHTLPTNQAPSPRTISGVPTLPAIVRPQTTLLMQTVSIAATSSAAWLGSEQACYGR